MKLFKQKLKILLLATSVFCALLFYGFFTQAKKTPNTITIGSKNCTEQHILAEIIAQLIEKETVLSVKRLCNLDGTTIAFQALKSKTIDCYVEYTGTAQLEIFKKPLPSDGLYEEVKEAFERQDLLFLDPLGFANQYVLVAKRERGWKTLSDLTEGLSLAIDPELAVREDFRILCTHYALSSKPKLMDQVLLAFSLQSGAIDVMSGFSTEPRLLDEEFIILEDDKGVLPAYVAAPLIRKETIEEHPELLAVFAMLKNQITSEQVAQLSQQVELGQRAPQAVVADYLARVALKPPVQREPRQR